MTISSRDWDRFVERLAALCQKAADELMAWVTARGGPEAVDRSVLIDYAYALATRYGEGTAALSAAWYDAVAQAAGQVLPPAEAAATATYAETAKAINGVLKYSQNEEVLSGAVYRLVKLPGVDTTMQNAIRDHAQWAWIPRGETCAFCIALASRGWQEASKAQMDGHHAKHVHANCKCTYQIRWDDSSGVAGYDPDRYREMYDDAEGRSSRAKINSMRRDFYAENRDEIREQQNDAYARRIELNSSAAEEADV